MEVTVNLFELWGMLLLFPVICILLYQSVRMPVSHWKQYSQNVKKRFAYKLSLFAFCQFVPVFWLSFSILSVEILRGNTLPQEVLWVIAISALIAIIGYICCERMIKKVKKQQTEEPLIVIEIEKFQNQQTEE